MHVLQRLLLPLPGLPEELYLRLRNPAEPHAAALRPGPEGELPLGPGDVLSTDTFFGAFYRAVWRARTGVREIALVVQLRGEVRIRVFEDTGTGSRTGARPGVRRLCSHDLAAPERQAFRIAVPAVDPAPGLGATTPASRIFVEIEALRASDLFALDVVTPTPPLRAATLSVGLVTFNQEARFARTLDALTRLADETAAIGTIHVVNQGAEFASDAIRDLLAHPGVRAVRQRNLGGCGGFTRTLAAALEGPASHHLMMDDDIVLDPRMILRALAFLDHAETDIALGAGMLDALQPTVMYEAGAFLRPDNTIAPHAHNVDLADPEAQHHFNAPVATDYNAWWFCILPLEPCRAVGLPAPVFLRGDDFEYGQRLARAGVPTVTLPGIAVWHEPFYAKPQGWQSYYDLRNRLIFAATYPDRVRQLSLAHVAGLITTAILTHSYAVAALRLRAVEDFLKGPEALFSEDAEALHGQVAALARAEAPERLDDHAWAPVPPAPARPRRDRMAGLIAQQAISLLRTGFGPLHRQAAVVLMDADAHAANTAGRAYVLTNAMRSFHLCFVPRRGRMWRLMGQALRTVWRYHRARSAAGRAWADGIPPYRTPGWWAGVFAGAGPETGP